MKRFLAFLVLACLAMPFGASAAEQKIGVYVAPKFIGGIQTYNPKVEISGFGLSDSSGLGTKEKFVFGGALAVGYDFIHKFNVPVRIELEYAAFSNAKVDESFDSGGIIEKWKAKVGIQSLFANVYYDFKNSTAFTPYIGGGIGFGFVKSDASLNLSDSTTGATLLDGSSGSKTNTNFAFNLGLGCAYAVNETISIDLGYRYANFGKARTKSVENILGTGISLVGKAKNVDMHQLVLGARFTF